MPDIRSLTPLPWRPNVARLACDVHVEGEEWPYCPRTILRRQLERARSLGFEFMLGIELEYFLVRQLDDGSIELADPLDTLDQPCYDMRGLTRNLDFVSQVARQHHRARLEQLRQRPRGRERPVRAELRLRRRAHHLRPRDLLPLHGRVAGAGAGADRHLHAEAVLAPDRQRLPLPHEPLEGRRERVRGRSRRRPARHGPLAARLQLHRRAEGARQGLHRGDGADRQLVQAARGGHAQRLQLGAGVRLVRLQQPHADAAHPRRGPDRGPHRRRLLQPLPGRDRGAGGRARRRSSASSTRASPPPSSTCTS